MLSAVGFFVSLLLALSYLTVGVLSSPHDGHTFFVRRPPLCRPPYRPCPQHTELTAMDLGGQEGSDEAAAAKISRRSRIIFKVRWRSTNEGEKKKKPSPGRESLD